MYPEVMVGFCAGAARAMKATATELISKIRVRRQGIFMALMILPHKPQEKTNQIWSAVTRQPLWFRALKRRQVGALQTKTLAEPVKLREPLMRYRIHATPSILLLMADANLWISGSETVVTAWSR